MPHHASRNSRLHFCKYTTRTAALAIIENKSLRWSSPARFNDPFDHQTGFSWRFTGEELGRAIVDVCERVLNGEQRFEPMHPTSLGQRLLIARSLLKHRRAEVIAKLKEEAREMATAFPEARDLLNRNIVSLLVASRVLCLTESHDNVVMWSHYADEHRGVAFKFRRLEDRDHSFCAAQPVQYTTDPVYFAEATEYVQHLLGIRELDLPERVWPLTLQKHEDWRYEREWRVRMYLSTPEVADYSYVSEPPELFEAMFIGCKVTDEELASLRAACRQHLPDMKLYRGHRVPGSLRLEFDPIDGG